MNETNAKENPDEARVGQKGDSNFAVLKNIHKPESILENLTHKFL